MGQRSFLLGPEASPRSSVFLGLFLGVPSLCRGTGHLGGWTQPGLTPNENRGADATHEERTQGH